ncbi:hypothetical protein DPMN_031717 [Dreissena polymorpha]|uniref:Uncharacterized protein n=1 Tax=Dreissena polymorpha TaxID=45954 RepID=A0A9D4M1J8_DREPO|nr:hypothetical protein DPMN_031717 [Dreissena polymorpha]
MTMEEPGVVTMRTGVGCPEVKVTVAMDCDHISYQRPQIVDAKGLSRKRQTYNLSCQTISQRCLQGCYLPLPRNITTVMLSHLWHLRLEGTHINMSIFTGE